MNLPLDEPLITFPYLKKGNALEGVGGSTPTIVNPRTESVVELTDGVRQALKFFQEGATLAELVEASDLDDAGASKFVESLVRNFMVVKKKDLEWLRNGLCRRTARPVGVSIGFADIGMWEKQPSFAVFGVPADIGGIRGADVGPQAIRVCMPKLANDDGGRMRTLIDFENERQFTELPFVVDLGNVCVVAGDTMATIGNRISFLLEGLRKAGVVPIMLGGDHSWTFFALSDLVRANVDFGIIHIDAHHDMYPDIMGDLNHANPFLTVLESKNLKHFLQIGLRTLQRPDESSILLDEPRLRFLSARRIANMSCEEVFAGLPRDIPYYVTFDVDGMDVAETGSPVVGGISYYDGLRLFEYIATNFRIIGADFMEVAGDPLGRNLAAETAGRFLFELIVGRQPSQPIRGYVTHLKQEVPFL